MFCIVKFPDEKDAVAVVPRVWLKKKSCLWPPFSLNGDKFKKAVQNCELPESTKAWGTCRAEVLKTFDTYSAARSKLEKSTLTSELSDSESSNSDENQMKLKRTSAALVPPCDDVKKRKNQSESVIHPYAVFSMNEVDLAQDSPDNEQSNSSPMQAGHNFVDAEGSDNSDALLGTDSSNHSNPQSNPAMISDIPVGKSAFADGGNRQILNYLADLKVRLERVESKLDAISKTNCVDASFHEDAEFEDFPFDTYKSFETFVKRDQDKEFKKKLIGRFSSLGGRKPSLHVSSIMGDLITDEVAKGYSWCGQRGNRNFSELGLLNLIFIAVRKASKNGAAVTKAEVKELIDSWLRHSKDRIIAKSKQKRVLQVDDQDDDLDDL